MNSASNEINLLTQMSELMDNIIENVRKYDKKDCFRVKKFIKQLNVLLKKFKIDLVQEQLVSLLHENNIEIYNEYQQNNPLLEIENKFQLIKEITNKILNWHIEWQHNQYQIDYFTGKELKRLNKLVNTVHEITIAAELRYISLSEDYLKRHKEHVNIQSNLNVRKMLCTFMENLLYFVFCCCCCCKCARNDENNESLNEIINNYYQSEIMVL